MELGGGSKFQIPNPKFQINSKYSISPVRNFYQQKDILEGRGFLPSRFGGWDFEFGLLELICYLVLVIWCFP
jgi:hypothetical protein